MKVAELNESQTERLVVGNEHLVTLPDGLLGFEGYTKFVLLANREEAPFHWLQVLEDPRLAFLVISPFEVCPGYELNIPDQDAARLGIHSPQDALIFNIVTIRPDGSATVNLKGPVILNRQTLVGKQIVPLNAADLPIQHPLQSVS